MAGPRFHLDLLYLRRRDQGFHSNPTLPLQTDRFRLVIGFYPEGFFDSVKKTGFLSKVNRKTALFINGQ